MGYVKLVKNKAYFKRFQTKFRRRREGKTDYYARKRLIWQDKNKYATPKYRLVVRISNRYVVCQIIYAKIEGDCVIASASSQELKHYGVKLGLKNYAAAYCTGLLIARRLLKQIKLDHAYGLVNDAESEKTESAKTARRPFLCVLDVGLARTSTGANVFGALKGAVDGGLEIPHNNSRFPGSSKDGHDEKMHRDRIFGRHVGDFLAKAMEGDEPEIMERNFQRYVKENITCADDMERMYQEAHEKIRLNPDRISKPEYKVNNDVKNKQKKQKKMSLSQRKDRIKRKKASLLSKLKKQTG